ncbi:MAG: HD-GYP domain-containing protein [Sphingomonas sp.]
MLRRISRDQARLGMYIHAFDGAWLRHPFWRRRFLLSSPDDLTTLLESDVISLVIDESRGVRLTPHEPLPALKTTRATTTPPRSEPTAPKTVAIQMKRPLDRPCSVAEERDRATRVMTRSKRVIKGVFDDARLGKAIRSEDVAPLVEDISASVTRNSQALIGLTRLKSKDEYTYLHSVAVCALMVNFAKHLDLNPAEVHELGVAGLLHDVGKMMVPDLVLNKPSSLTDEEFAIVRTHPQQGYQMLKEGGGIPDLALDVCLHHHERVDGTGYPNKLHGDQISLAARMGAICDVYDALTSDRIYKKAWAPDEAIIRMHGWHGHFDRALLFKFMQSISVFPFGMLVRLRSNRLGIVLENGRRASRPQVRAFFSTRDRSVLAIEDVVIDDNLASDQILSEEDPAAWGFMDWTVISAQVLAGSTSLLSGTSEERAA